MDVLEINKLQYFKNKLVNSREWSDNFRVELDKDKMQLEVGFNEKTFKPFIFLNYALEFKIMNFSKQMSEEEIREITNILFRLYRIKCNFEK